MVALAILGIGLGVIFQGIGQGLRLRGEAAEKVRLALVAESVIGTFPERTEAPEKPIEGEQDGCRWRLEAVGRAAVAAATPGASGASGTTSGSEERPAELVETRLTVTAPSGLSWEMYTLLPTATEVAP